MSQVLESRRLRRRTESLTSLGKVQDRGVWYVALAATITSIFSTIYYVVNQVTMLYPDSVAHMEIARRFFDSATPGFGQLGGVWLPLPHVLMLPFIGFDGLYYSGLAGSIVSMASYVVAAVYIYRVIRGLNGGRWAAFAGTAVFAFNPNILYMQTTPMSELLLFAAVIASVFYVQQWTQIDKYRSLFYAGIACLAGTLTRYEAWITTAILMGVVGIIAWKRKGYRRAEGTVLTLSVLAALGVAGWVVWNWMIFGNPLNWQNGEYAKSSLWVGSNEPSMGHLWISIQTFWYAVVGNLGLIITCLLFAGMGCLVLVRRKLDVLPVVSLMGIWLFFIVALYTGQRPLHVMQVSGDLYNVRFGLIMVLPAAIVVGYLLSLTRRIYVRIEAMAAGVVVFGMVGIATITSTPVLVKEPEVWAIAARHSESTEAAAFLKEHYDDGLVLATFFGSENVFFDARIPLSRNIYEGNYLLWEEALNSPTDSDIRWIVMRSDDAGDAVFTQLHESSELSAYQLVYDKNGYRIYKER